MQQQSRKWSSIVPGELIRVLVPQIDGSYEVQSAEIIQSKPDRYDGFWFLKFKITGADGKRLKIQNTMSLTHDDEPVLCVSDRISSVFTTKITSGNLIITTLEDDDMLNKIQNDMILDQISVCENIITDMQDKIEKLKTKLK